MININQLKRYLDNQCKPGELKEILHWLSKEGLSSCSYDKVSRIWYEHKAPENFCEDHRLERILDKLHHKINISYNQRSKTDKSEKTTISFFVIITRVAAVLFVPLLIYTIMTWNTNVVNRRDIFFGNPQNIEVISPLGSRSFIELPDGTGVHLNHGSKLIYPQSFKGDSRNVILQGEAYFSVAHDPVKPFNVETGTLVITALGTEFNVMAYPGQAEIETTLKEGKIAIQKQKDGTIQETINVMEPHQHLVYKIKDDHFSCSEVDIDKYISWKDGILVFRNDPLKDIAFRLGRWYNVDFEFKSDSLKDFPYTATFVDETLYQILDLLQLATPIKYEITRREKKSDGTFSKPKIIIDSK